MPKYVFVVAVEYAKELTVDADSIEEACDAAAKTKLSDWQLAEPLTHRIGDADLVEVWKDDQEMRLSTILTAWYDVT